MDERTLQDAVIELAAWQGWHVHHDLPSQSASGNWRTHVAGNVGFPDLVLARADAVLFVELKTDTGRLSKAQLQWMALLEAATLNTTAVGYRLWRPEHWTNGTIEKELANG